MKPSVHFCQFSRKIALDATDAYVNGFGSRLVPAFDNIDEEASAAANEAWNRAMSAPMVNENADPSEFAEAAQEYGLEVYENLKFVRQQLIGLATAGLYHLWERLLKQFFCKELRDWTFDGKRIDSIMAPATFPDLQKCLLDFGFDLQRQSYYATLGELRLVANVVKHGDGKSCEDLKCIAPQLFEGYRYHFNIFSEADKLELNPADFKRYAEAIRQFWSTLPEHLELNSP